MLCLTRSRNDFLRRSCRLCYPTAKRKKQQKREQRNSLTSPLRSGTPFNKATPTALLHFLEMNFHFRLSCFQKLLNIQNIFFNTASRPRRNEVILLIVHMYDTYTCTLNYPDAWVLTPHAECYAAQRTWTWNSEEVILRLSSERNFSRVICSKIFCHLFIFFCPTSSTIYIYISIYTMFSVLVFTPLFRDWTEFYFIQKLSWLLCPENEKILFVYMHLYIYI